MCTMSDIINVHTATLVDLQKIHKIGPKKAKKIIEACGEDGSRLTMAELVLASDIAQAEWAEKVCAGEVFLNFPEEDLRIRPSDQQALENRLGLLSQQLAHLEIENIKLKQQNDID